MLIWAFITAFILSMVLTPMVIRLAHKMGATDKPNERKVHDKVMPRMGGLAIFASFFIAYVLFGGGFPNQLPILLGAFVIIIIGIFDDIYELRARTKFVGQIAAALIIVYWGGLEVEFINLPFGGQLDFGFLSIPVTILWIVAITNAINLIDGLDGLAGGVSSIALVTISVMALLQGDMFVATIALIVTGSTLGFLKYNFHPAKIFMGDTGALFLGYIIAVLSLLGFKNVTMISLIVPIIILGVPLSDTFYAIIRRLVNKQPLAAPDKSHLHHCLLRVGYSHSQTVILIYALAASFGLAAIIFSYATMWGAILIIGILLITIEIIVEKVGLVGSNYQPLLKMLSTAKNASGKNK
ncbi:glycosyltransferase family 4 protein [Bacillus sp. V59.32b]|uniref:glycosyltransferase family 4 protein n=1 Tax=Bacillus sp. V59.32b TaxID=1758642 RepID=UPI000E3ED91B|nr:MraY family glycosyltransferase [Bacillus sp. V59.32b]RFU66851.1 undecaprenyl/decaprenyl-phosphate alpha-N-acetylglucosaminyl 1-phosphate transferase [Bacillus sp. V59.32b]